MKPIRKIMACIDLSDYSPMTLEYALGLAKAGKADLVVFSVVHNRNVHPVYLSDSMYPYQLDTDLQVSRLKEHQESQVVYLIKNDFPNREKEISIEVDVGYPSETIVNAVETLGVDLVIMANKGRSNLSRFMFGSAAEGVFRRCPVPLLSLRDKEVFRRHPNGEARPAAHEIKTIMAAVDFSPWTDEVLAHAGWLARSLGAGLKIMNCISEDELDWIKTHFIPRGSFSKSRFLPGEKERRKKMVMDRLGELGMDALSELKVTIDSGNPLEQVLNAVDTEDADLLVLGPRGRNRSGGFILGSTIEKLFRHCPVPVMRLGPELRK
ncbi:MAG: universal stress protein [Desulfobacter sp.]|nr:universal stress protein [Desulfobacter sp.]WDP87439.1 MAG: universal stress protein [Desulfobacter sp.]